MSEQHEQFWEIMVILDEASVLEHIMVIGSWAEYLYQESGILEGFTANFKTRDLDLLIPNIRKPRKTINLPEIFKEHDYMTDYAQNGQIKIFRSPALELEFLVTEKGRGQIEPYPTHMGVKAEGLRELNYLSENKLPLAIKGLLINVPKPEAYILHKIMIHPARKEEKKEKDLRSILNLLENHYQKNADLLNQLKESYELLSKKEKKNVLTFCKDNFVEWMLPSDKI